MSRLIDADALMADLKQSHDWLLNIYEGLLFETEKRVCSAEIATFNEIGLRIKAAPTIEAEPVRHGRWVREDDFASFIDVPWLCSECSGKILLSGLYTPVGHGFKHCPMCGAKMDGDHNV